MCLPNVSNTYTIITEGVLNYGCNTHLSTHAQSHGSTNCCRRASICVRTFSPHVHTQANTLSVCKRTILIPFPIRNTLRIQKRYLCGLTNPPC